MDSKEICEKIINNLNGKFIGGSLEPLLVKFADGGPKKTKPDKVWRGHDDVCKIIKNTKKKMETFNNKKTQAYLFLLLYRVNHKTFINLYRVMKVPFN